MKAKAEAGKAAATDTGEASLAEAAQTKAEEAVKRTQQELAERQCSAMGAHGDLRTCMHGPRAVNFVLLGQFQV